MPAGERETDEAGGQRHARDLQGIRIVSERSAVEGRAEYRKWLKQFNENLLEDAAIAAESVPVTGIDPYKRKKKEVTWARQPSSRPPERARLDV